MEFEYLGPYKIERTLGRGGMGTVYKGVHAKSGEAVAIKLIASGIASHMRFRRRFATEVETLKRLKHPNIVQLIGYGEEHGQLFYSMEFVEGHSLYEHLRQHVKLSWEDVVQVGIETTSALKHAHDMGIIHRDLKPANLMLNADGRIKLTDFGIAKLFGATDMTAVGSVIGTADYMPPEQAEGKGVTVRSDLYSLGSVLYALLSGKAPFGGKSVPEVLYSVRYNRVPSLQTRAPDAPPELIELIHQMLEKDPAKRPPTALVVRNRLQSLQHGMQHLSARSASADADTGNNPQEVVATQLTSLDLSEVEDDELKLTGEESASPNDSSKGPSGITYQRGEALGTHEVQTLIAPANVSPSGNPATSVAPERQQLESNASELSGEFRSLASGGEPLSSGGPSHFTPMAGEAEKTSRFGLHTPDEDEKFDWLHYASIAGMIALLLGSIALGGWLLRPESADSIYNDVTAAADSGQDERLLQASGLIEEFLERFPDDERTAELQALLDEVELARWTRILQRRASRAGGTESLNAIEQAFLECMQLLSQDDQRGQAKLASFIHVFGAIEHLPRDERRLVHLAEYALRSGARTAEVSEAALQLQELIQSAEDSLPKERLQAFYRNLLSLYGDMPWATQQMERIRKKLETEF